jgi:hypothetical protein
MRCASDFGSAGFHLGEWESAPEPGLTPGGCAGGLLTTALLVSLRARGARRSSLLCRATQPRGFRDSIRLPLANELFNGSILTSTVKEHSAAARVDLFGEQTGATSGERRSAALGWQFRFGALAEGERRATQSVVRLIVNPKPKTNSAGQARPPPRPCKATVPTAMARLRFALVPTPGTQPKPTPAATLHGSEPAHEPDHYPATAPIPARSSFRRAVEPMH